MCIHAPRRAWAAAATAALDAADRAWDALTGPLGLPAPDSLEEGRWSVYLVEHVAGLGDARLAGLDPASHFDRGLSFGVVDAAVPPGCDLDLALARSIARAAVWRAAPATDEATARAESEMLARLAVPCADDEADARAFQERPEQALNDASSPAYERGSSAFYAWLDAQFARDPGALVRSLMALAPTRTPPGASGWSTIPTGFDVLRRSLRGVLGTGSTFDDVLGRFAVARAELHPGPRLAWHVPWPQAPRRLESPVPVSPTGASYVMVDHAGARPGARLRVEAAWEDYARMRWFVVKLDGAGRATAVMPVTSLNLGTRASLTVEDLDGVDKVLVVAANVGSTERPFDPHQAYCEPHAWLLTLASE